jgi:hypothetical protein
MYLTRLKGCARIEVNFRKEAEGNAGYAAAKGHKPEAKQGDKPEEGEKNWWGKGLPYPFFSALRDRG